MYSRPPINDDFQWCHSEQLGAPQMDGLGGYNENNDMLLLLDAVLVEGWGENDVESVDVSGASVTLNYLGNHGYAERQSVVISGANDVALNGKYRISSKTSRAITLNVIGVSDTTGAIKTRVAPLGWESVLGSAEPLKRAYRSLDPDSTKTVLYLDMSTELVGSGYHAVNPNKRAMVSMCSNMTDLGEQIGSYTNEVNNKDIHVNGSLFWYQARNTTTSTEMNNPIKTPWVIIGNGDYFYFFNSWQNYNGRMGLKYRDLYMFGDVPSLAGASDDYNCMLMCAYNENDKNSVSITSNGNNTLGIADYPSSRSGKDYCAYFIKRISGVGSLMPAAVSPSGSNFGFYSGHPSKSASEVSAISYPNPTSGSLVCMPLYALEIDSIRGVMPRIMSIPQDLSKDNPEPFDLVIVDDVITIAVHHTFGDTGYEYGYFAVDLGD